MKEPLLITNKISIKASPNNVWNVLVNPEETKKYMFGCETVSDWKEGSSLEWKMLWEGKEMIAVKGNILKIIPGKHLSYTTIDPNNPLIPDVPENYLTVTYDLKEEENGTELIVTQGDYNKVADGDSRYQEASNNGEGWNPILMQIKIISELS